MYIEYLYSAVWFVFLCDGKADLASMFGQCTDHSFMYVKGQESCLFVVTSLWFASTSATFYYPSEAFITFATWDFSVVVDHLKIMMFLWNMLTSLYNIKLELDPHPRAGVWFNLSST